MRVPDQDHSPHNFYPDPHLETVYFTKINSKSPVSSVIRSLNEIILSKTSRNASNSANARSS